MTTRVQGSSLKLGRHPMALSIKDLKISAKPFMACSYAERFVLLPQGAPIEKKVKPFNGYWGQKRNGKHEVVYGFEGIK